jgi:hypothetical protein
LAIAAMPLTADQQDVLSPSEAVLMRTCFIYSILLVCLQTSSFGQTSVITSLQSNGVITWTNSVSNAIYRIEWASTLNGSWQSSWDSLRNIATDTNLSTSASVPMFYRVTMIPEADILTIIAKPSSIAADTEMSVLSVSGGVPPYSWSVSDPGRGNFPSGITGNSVIYRRYSTGQNAVNVTDGTNNTAWFIIQQP